MHYINFLKILIVFISSITTIALGWLDDIPLFYIWISFLFSLAFSSRTLL